MKIIVVVAVLLTIGPQAVLAQGTEVAGYPRAAQSSKREEANLMMRAYRLISAMTLEQKAAQMQDQAPAIPRLGIPAYGWWNEALHGVTNSRDATYFPHAVGLALIS